jgi:hypothetical protein
VATYSDIISGALRHLGIRAAESPMTAAEADDGLKDLNDMGEEWEPEINIGYVSSTDVNATINIPRSTHAAFKANLAVRIAPQYSRVVSPALVSLASNTYASLMNSSVHIEVDFPDTLPKGSGNDCPELLDNRFFPQNQKQEF